MTVPVTPMWTVQIRWLEADGTPVKKGQRVVEFDSSQFGVTLEDRRLAVSQAESEMARFEAEAKLQEEERTFTREERLIAVQKARIDASLPAFLRSRRDHEESQLALRKAELELAKSTEDLGAALKGSRAERTVREIALERAKKELRIAEDTVSALTVHAPRDGIFVVGDNPRESRKFQEGDNVWPSMPVGRIPDLTRLQVLAWLPDVDDGRIKPGLKALLIPDALPDRILNAEISEISPLAQPPAPDSLRRAFRVSLPIHTGNIEGLRPGMSVRAEIRTGASTALTALLSASLASESLMTNHEEVAVRREDIAVTVETQGSLQALNSQQIGPPQIREMWEYRISFMAQEGSAVKKGDSILGFDTASMVEKFRDRQTEAEAAAKRIESRKRDLEIQAQELSLNLAEAEARKRKAQLKVEVPKDLDSANKISLARLDLELATKEADSLNRRLALATRSAAAELEILERMKKAAGNRVEDLQQGLTRMSVVAPRAGTLIYLTNWRGDKKKTGDVCWLAEKVMEVPDLSQIGLKAEIDEAESGLVKEDQRMRITLEAHPDTPFRGKVSLVRRMVTRRSAWQPLKVMRIEGTLDAVDTQKMRPGMRFKGEIEVDRARQVLAVPLDALFLSETGAFVFGKGMRRIPVSIGRRNQTKAEVLSGLTEGSVILKPVPAKTKKDAL